MYQLKKRTQAILKLQKDNATNPTLTNLQNNYNHKYYKNLNNTPNVDTNNK